MVRPDARGRDGWRVRLAGAWWGVSHWPDLRGWRRAAPAAALVVAGVPLALASGLVAVDGGRWAVGWRYQLVPFAVPGLVEEVLFRGLLLPHPRWVRPWTRRAPWWVASLAIYLAAHPLVAWWLRPEARGVFDRPAFLIEAAALGVAATVAFERSGSLWPAIVLHGAVVAAWLTLGGATLLGLGG